MKLNMRETELFKIVEEYNNELNLTAGDIMLNALDRFDDLSKSDILLLKKFICDCIEYEFDIIIEIITKK